MCVSHEYLLHLCTSTGEDTADESVSRIRGWELTFKVDISLGWILERHGCLWVGYWREWEPKPVTRRETVGCGVSRETCLCECA